MIRRLLLWASENRWLAGRLPRQAFVRRAVRRFMPGEDRESAFAVTAALGARRVGTVLTVLGENVADEAAARAVADDYAATLAAIRERGLDAEVSVKLTHLGLDLGDAVAERHLRAVAAAEPRADRTVWVDMEGSAYTQRTLDLFLRVVADHPRLGLCVQAYLHRTAADLEALIRAGAGVRVVKGAYAEPPAIAIQAKGEVDASFVRLCDRLIEARAAGFAGRIAVATHDPRMVRAVERALAAHGRPRTDAEFQMLYGIGRDEQDRLAAAGTPLRVLVSYGEAWFPWYMRRLAERPANLWFVVRSLVRR